MNLENFCLWFSANVLEALPTRGMSRTKISPRRGASLRVSQTGRTGAPGGSAPTPSLQRLLRGGLAASGGAGTCGAGGGGNRAVEMLSPGASCQNAAALLEYILLRLSRPPVNFQGSQRGDPLCVSQRPLRPPGETVLQGSAGGAVTPLPSLPRPACPPHEPAPRTTAGRLSRVSGE